MTVMACTFLLGLEPPLQIHTVLLLTVYNYFLDFNGFITLSQPYSKNTWSILTKFTQLNKWTI